MRIGIDARLFSSQKKTGIATVQYEIVKQIAVLDHSNEYFLISRSNVILDFKIPKSWRIIVAPFPIGMIWYNTRLVQILKENKIDVFWNCNHILPMVKPAGVKYVLTVHDLAIFKFRNIGDTSNIIKQRIFLKRSCFLADKIVAVSQSTRADIHNILHIPEDKIVICYNGGSPQFPHVSEKEANKTINRFGLVNAPYIFYLGTLEPRKNLETLLSAFEMYKKRENSQLKLVIAGGTGWKYKKLLERLENSEYSNDIIRTGYVSNVEKKALMLNARAFIFPSLYEGFGIPILEALQVGTPVITSRVSAMPEVAGPDAIYVDDPMDVAGFSQAIKKTLALSADSRRQIISSGYRQAALFSWDISARTMIQVFETSQL